MNDANDPVTAHLDVLAARLDVLVVGAGLVGLATAERLLASRPGLRLAVVEKEAAIARHQSGHNSGVIHSGLYYRPGSLKARACVAGRAELLELCEREGVPHRVCGKLIVATEHRELPALDELARRGRANGVECHLVDGRGIEAREPHARGLAGLHVPGAGVVDFPAVAGVLARRVVAAGGAVVTGAPVTAIASRGSEAVVRAGEAELATRLVVACAGLHADRVARMAGARPRVRIVPFRGEYRELAPHARALCRSLIYPVPDPALPFLGVHLTRRIDERVECGPNAVLALAREGYRRRDVSLRDAAGMLAFPGLVRLAVRHRRSVLGETRRSFSSGAFARDARRLVPGLLRCDLLPGGSGVRAQALDRQGRLVDDFVIEETATGLFVLNAPSPAATASLAIGRDIAARALARLA